LSAARREQVVLAHPVILFGDKALEASSPFLLSRASSFILLRIPKQKELSWPVSEEWPMPGEAAEQVRLKVEGGHRAH
jgi:hypothetical protein